MAFSSSDVLTLLVPFGTKVSEFALGLWEGYDLKRSFCDMPQLVNNCSATGL